MFVTGAIENGLRVCLPILVFKNYMKCICDLLEFIGMLLTESIIKELNLSNVTFIQQVL